MKKKLGLGIGSFLLLRSSCNEDRAESKRFNKSVVNIIMYV